MGSLMELEEIYLPFHPNVWLLKCCHKSLQITQLEARNNDGRRTASVSWKKCSYKMYKLHVVVY